MRDPQPVVMTQGHVSYVCCPRSGFVTRLFKYRFPHCMPAQPASSGTHGVSVPVQRGTMDHPIVHSAPNRTAASATSSTSPSGGAGTLNSDARQGLYCLIRPATTRGDHWQARPKRAYRRSAQHGDSRGRLCRGDSSLPSAPRVRVIHPDTATGPVQRRHLEPQAEAL